MALGTVLLPSLQSAANARDGHGGGYSALLDWGLRLTLLLGPARRRGGAWRCCPTAWSPRMFHYGAFAARERSSADAHGGHGLFGRIYMCLLAVKIWRRAFHARQDIRTIEIKRIVVP